MKRYLLLLTTLIFTGVQLLLAQDISVKSFRLLPNDLTARVDPVTNDNGQTCALVKIVTTERGFEFDPDALGMCGSVDENHAGEVWIWIAPGSRRLTIRHKDLKVLRGYEYPVNIESACVYEMVLVTGHVTTIVEEQNRSNFLALTVTPIEAMVKIDGNVKELSNGQLSELLSVGEHSYELFCKLYHPRSGKFIIEPDKTTELNLQLQPNYGFLKVVSEPESGASVFIDGSNVGTTPYTSERLQSGSYTVQVAKKMYKDDSRQVTVNDNETTKVTLTLAPNFAEPMFVCADSEAEIWVNGEKKGLGRWSSRLPAGTYRVEVRKEAHRTTTKQLAIRTGDNSTVTLEAPVPIVGKVSVNSSPFGATIFLDGKNVGTTPKILNQVLIGNHELRIEKTGCPSSTRTVIVEEGKMAEVSVELPTSRTVTLKSEPIGADIYVDGTHVGIAPCSSSLTFGLHRIKAELEGVEKEETVTVSEQGQSEWTLNVQKVSLLRNAVTDYDGNSYNAVQIGSQLWMAENLRTTHYADGTAIPRGSSKSTSTGYWYYPNGESANKTTYGLLYNWKAVMRASNSSRSNPSKVQGICPIGWHVPSDAEWTQLTDYVSSQNENVCGSSISNIAKSLAGVTGWKSCGSDCTVGNAPSLNNTVGFSILPSGDYTGSYNLFGLCASFWSATENDGNSAYDRYLGFNYIEVIRGYDNKSSGFSVRCVRDSWYDEDGPEVVPEVEAEEPPVRFVEHMPEYPGGITALQQFLVNHLKYPDSARAAGAQGIVLVEFVVEKDGSVTNVKVLESLWPDLDEEAVRVVRTLPKWKPGETKGEKVRVYYNLPIRFEL